VEGHGFEIHHHKKRKKEKKERPLTLPYNSISAKQNLLSSKH
jgi:hypothetical protein